MKEALLESLLRQMRLSRVLPTIKSFSNPHVLDVGCGWEARLLKEIAPFIAKGVGIDFKAPDIQTDKLHTFAYFFESKDSQLMGGGQKQVNVQNDEICEDSHILSPSHKNTESNDSSDSLLSSPLHCHLPFANESFDVVCLLAVLEHLSYPLDMLYEIARVLKPNGALVLTVPSHLAKPVLEFLSYKLKIVSEEEIRDHKRYYNKQDLLELIAAVPSLHLQKHKYFQCKMNNFAIIKKER